MIAVRTASLFIKWSTLMFGGLPSFASYTGAPRFGSTTDENCVWQPCPSARSTLTIQIPAAALPRPGMRIDASGLQVGVTRGGRHQRDWSVIVYGVRRVGVAQPVDRRGSVDAGTLSGCQINVVLSVASRSASDNSIVEAARDYEILSTGAKARLLNGRVVELRCKLRHETLNVGCEFR
jgi:hypothetical protein